MMVIPALDLRDGKCVRMEQGDTSKQTTYDDDPVERARTFVAAGAQRLHVIDLDAALGSGNNQEAIANICQAVSVPVQVGGGIRSLSVPRATSR
jgi:phosphoribosylformimino-5-aminoimidazole carboxamide ribotide isomerase